MGVEDNHIGKYSRAASAGRWVLSIGAGLAAAAFVWGAVVERPTVPPYVYTESARYDANAWKEGRERFPSGAALTLVSNGDRRKIAPGFYASADAAISFDGHKVLFAGKRTAAERWQIWEADLEGGPARQVSSGIADCLRPLYLPAGRAVYTRLWAQGSQLETVALEGGKAERLTFAPGWVLTDDVLRDGRILFEAGGELWTVYPDGTGVESLRCDHGPNRAGARQVASGDVIFSVDGRLARFTSPSAKQVPVAQPEREAAAPVAEVSAGVWLLALRSKPPAPFGLSLWTAATGRLAEVAAPAGANSLQPVIVAPRTPPREFPSALSPARATGNLLCLNARESKLAGTEAGRAVKFYTQGAGKMPVLLGQTAMESDGSFYVQLPADKPLRLEILDASGRAVAAERNWFWMRPSEQRICVGCHLGPERAPENRVPEVLLRSTIPQSMLGNSGGKP